MTVRVEETHNASGVVRFTVSGSSADLVEDKVREYLRTYPTMGYDTRVKPQRFVTGTYMQGGTRNSSC